MRSWRSRRAHKSPSSDWKIRYSLMLGLERVLSDRPPHLKSGTELRRHQVDALAGMLTELIAAAQREPEAVADEPDEEFEDEEEYENGDAGENGDAEVETTRTRTTSVTAASDPGAIRRYRFRHPTASGKTIAAAGFVEAARTIGVLILTHRRLLVTQFNRELKDEGYGERITPEITGDGRPPKVDPITIQTYAWFARHVGGPEPRGVPARDLRRGAHGARREDERRDPQLPGAGLHRDDGDRAADREAGLRRLPRLGRRPSARRRRAPRPDRAAPLPARPARRGDQLGADRRRRLRPGARSPRCSTTSRSTRPPRASTASASTRRRGSSTPPASTTPTTSRRSSAPPA